MAIKIAFSGIGGVGGYYGAMLAAYAEKHKDPEVCFIARGSNLEAIREKGLRLQTPSEQLTVRPAKITDDPRKLGVVDYLFCTTKSYDLEENIQQLRPAIGPRTVLIPLLNGADITARIRSLLPGQAVWYGCVYIGARLTAPGLVTRFTERERLWFGDPDGDRQRQRQLLQILRQANIDAKNPEDILTRVWRKFFLISLSATITSYYCQSLGEVLAHHRNDYYRLGEELMGIAKARGIILPENMVERVIDDQLKMPYDSTTSMHTDFQNGKPTELETLTGYVVKSGKALHLPVENYEKMYLELKQRI